MSCEWFEARMPDGTIVSGFVCSRGGRRKRCATCGRSATALCDWKLAGKKKGKTCDAPICSTCATSPAKGKDLCPPHARLWAKHPANPARPPPAPQVVPDPTPEPRIVSEQMTDEEAARRINALPKEERLALAREILGTLRKGS